MLWLRRIAFALAIVAAILITVWATAALYFDSPFPILRAPAAVLYLVGELAIPQFFRHSRIGLLVAFTGFAIVALWWLSLKPSNDLDWQPDNAKTAYADIDGDQVVIHDFRNC